MMSGGEVVAGNLAAWTGDRLCVGEAAAHRLLTGQCVNIPHGIEELRGSSLEFRRQTRLFSFHGLDEGCQVSCDRDWQNEATGRRYETDEPETIELVLANVVTVDPVAAISGGCQVFPSQCLERKEILHPSDSHVGLNLCATRQPIHVGVIKEDR